MGGNVAMQRCTTQQEAEQCQRENASKPLRQAMPRAKSSASYFIDALTVLLLPLHLPIRA